MKTTSNMTAPVKQARTKTARRSKPATVKTTETTPPAPPVEADSVVTTTATKPAPATTPPAPIPSLTATFGAPLRIIFRDLGNKEVVSDIHGDFTLAKRLAMAYAIASRTASNYTGVACGDLTTAFTVIAFDPNDLCITVCLVTGTPTMDFPWADPEFAATCTSRVHVVALERSVIELICYSNLPRVSMTNDCPHCGGYVSLQEFTWEETSDAGERLVARCSSCGTAMKKR